MQLVGYPLFTDIGFRWSYTDLFRASPRIHTWYGAVLELVTARCDLDVEIRVYKPPF